MHFEDIEISEDELNKSNSSKLPVEVRKGILQRHKAGWSQLQIAEDMDLPRHRVRSVVNPGYSINYRKNKPDTDDTTASDLTVPPADLELTSIVPQADPVDHAHAMDQEEADQEREKRYSFTERAAMFEESKKYDPTATANDCLDDLRRLQKANPYKWLTRIGYRAEGKYSESTWTKYFGTFAEFRSEAGLEPTRYQKAHERNIAKHASLDHYGEFMKAEVAPNTLLYPRAERKRINTILAISDNHDKKQDPFVWRVFKTVAELLDPDVVLFNGDQNDLYEFNRYGVDPRQADVVASLSYVRDVLFREIRELLPDTQIDWNLGNHEMRVQKHMADKTPYLMSVLADFHGWSWADLFGVRDLEINVNCKWDLRAFTKRDIEDQVKQNYLVYWDSFVAKHIPPSSHLDISGTSGHTHRPETRTFANLARGKRTPLNWTITGSGCTGNAEYVEGLDKSSQGFAIFHVMPDTGIVVPENVIIQGDFAAVAGMYFYRQPNERC